MCKPSLYLIRTREIYISKDEYDASRSRMGFQLKPFDGEKWKQVLNIPLNIVSSWITGNKITSLSFLSKLAIQDLQSNALLVKLVKQIIHNGAIL